MRSTIDLPLVSVITPVLNRAESIGRCLQSVSSQSYPRIEHIVVDGGSSDGTLTILQGFESRRGFRWISEPDQGMYDAINKGLGLARGDIVAYVNSDDLYLPWTVETAEAELRRGADLIYGDLAVIARPSEGIGHVYLQFYRPFNLNYYTHFGTLAQPTVLWRRHLTDGIGMFDTGYGLIGDCEYWLRAAASGAKLVHIDEVLAIQVEHASTLRATHPKLLAEEFARLRRQYRPVAGPGRYPRLKKAGKSLRWRRNQLRMRLEMRKPNPSRWPQFIEFLRKNHISVNGWRLLLFFLPGRFRPGMATWLDPDVFEERLMAGFVPGLIARPNR